MADLEDAFNQLLDRQPTDGDRQRLCRARDTLNIKPTDAVWRLLMIMEHYQTMYEEIPRQIAEAARNATETIRVTAETQAKAAREETKKGLMKAVTEAVRATARQHARAEHFKWVSVAVSIVSITVLAVGWGENRRGQAQGWAAGESRAKAECAYATKLSTWALTPDGVRAYELEKLGSLHDLVSCSGRGLDRKGDWCAPNRSAASRTAGESRRATQIDRAPRRATSRQASSVEWLSPSRRWPITGAVHTYSTNAPPIPARPPILSASADKKV